MLKLFFVTSFLVLLFSSCNDKAHKGETSVSAAPYAPADTLKRYTVVRELLNKETGKTTFDTSLDVSSGDYDAYYAAFKSFRKSDTLNKMARNAWVLQQKHFVVYDEQGNDIHSRLSKEQLARIAGDVSGDLRREIPFTYDSLGNVKLIKEAEQSDLYKLVKRRDGH